MMFQPSISMIKQFQIKSLKIIVISFLLVTLFACQKSEIPQPTDEFYVNDFANQWIPATENTIYGEGKRLFETTEGVGDGGTQIVFASFLVDNISDISNYDKTDIYRAWEIGENDMGILVLFFYQKDPIEKDLATLIEIQVEVGYRMEQYVTPGQLVALTDSTLNNPLWEDQEEMAIAHFLYEILTLVYVDIYDYESFNYDMDQYQLYLETYDDTSDTFIDILLSILLLSDSNSLVSILITAGFLLFIGGSFSWVKHRGAGGSSGGAGIFRRKK